MVGKIPLQQIQKVYLLGTWINLQQLWKTGCTVNLKVILQLVMDKKCQYIVTLSCYQLPTATASILQVTQNFI